MEIFTWWSAISCLLQTVEDVECQNDIERWAKNNLENRVSNLKIAILSIIWGDLELRLETQTVIN